MHVHRVIESKNKDYSVGDVVIANLCWSSHTICNGDTKGLRKVDPKLDISPSTALGILGMPG